MPEVNPVELLANVLFSETKDYDDAVGIANVVNNRIKRPKRFGGSYQEVLFAPYQFSGVGSAEYNKAATRNFTDEEANIYKQFLQIANQAVRGTLEDTTGGADHYVNLKISKPKWSRIYKKTGKIGSHTYFSEQ